MADAFTSSDAVFWYCSRFFVGSDCSASLKADSTESGRTAASGLEATAANEYLRAPATSSAILRISLFSGGCAPSSSSGTALVKTR